MLACRKRCCIAARAVSKSVYRWRHEQKKHVVEREAWVLQPPCSTWRFPSWPYTTPPARPMLLLAMRGAKRAATRRTTPALHTSKPKKSGQQNKDQHPDVKSTSGLFVKWEIPWDGKRVLLTMTAIGVSCVFSGTALGIVPFTFGFPRPANCDEKSILVFMGLFLQTLVGTFVMKACIKRYSPLPKELFSYDWRDPFSARRGWLLWGVLGTFCSVAAVLLAVTVTNKEPFSGRQQIMIELLPLIGASGTSTALLLTGVGILAPFFEETVFRGFLLTSLTKWMPTHAAVLVSAGAFALIHFTPANLPEVFAMGVVLGFSYSKSGNLLTPIMIHGLWNSTMILLLAFLRHRGYNIQELMKHPTSIPRQPVNQTPHCPGKE